MKRVRKKDLKTKEKLKDVFIKQDKNGKYSGHIGNIEFCGLEYPECERLKELLADEEERQQLGKRLKENRVLDKKSL